MATPRPTIQFEHKGIGQALNDKMMRVPLNQREYAWKEEHVDDLFRDLHDAENSDATEYFLGTIVLTPGDDGTPQIADGQQRLATTSILLAAIRDFLVSHNEPRKAQLIDDRYLQTADIRSDETLPMLRLNVADDEYFRKTILSRVGSDERNCPSSKPSHVRISAAAALAATQVQNIVSGHTAEKAAARLIDWVDFLRDRARIILVTVPDEYDAFRMFETLNDRGVEAAQSDLLKNFLLGRSVDRMEEVQQRWASMVGALETVTGDEIVVTYLRHFYITGHGHTRERELFGKIRSEIRSKQSAVAFADALAENANHYVALLNANHVKWNAYGTTTRRHVATLLQLQVEQIRPLLLAVAKCFSVDETKSAFRLFVSWSVRLLIGGTSRGGRIDRDYAERAKEVGTGKITTTKQLARAMVDIIPNDSEFENNFATAKISRANLARYVLRSLETKAKGQADPELVANDDETSVNLEHVLPLTPGPAWQFDGELAASYFKRIGNLALLQAKTNVTIANSSFSVKAKALKKSAFILTAEAGAVAKWDAAAIDTRQKRLATLAVETWPIGVS